YVFYFEAACFRRPEAGMERDQFAIGKHVPVDKGWLVPEKARGRGDSGVQESPARPQQMPGSREILLQLRLAHVFEHSHGDDVVAWPFDLKVPVVADFYAASVVQTQFADTPPRPLRLGHAEGDADDLRAIVRSRMNRQPAPPTANVQQSLLATEPQLPADVVQLLALGCIQVSSFPVYEIGGGILHVLVQP